MSPRVPDYRLYALGAILSMILGFIVLASLPSSGTWAIGLLVGVDLIFWGARALVSASVLKGVERSM